MPILHALAREHWRPLALAGLCLACFTAGRFSVRPAPAAAVHEVLQEHKVDDKKADTEQHADVGGWTKTTYEFAAGESSNAPPTQPDAVAHGEQREHRLCKPEDGGVAPPAPFPPGLVEMVVERHDPTVIETHSHDVEQVTSDRRLDLTITPSAAPGWALQVGIEGLQARTVRVAARRRLFGPLWVELSAVPAQRSIGVAAAVEW